MKPPVEHDFPTPGECSRALAEQVADSLRDAVGERDAATLVVSGGRTPIPFFEKLAASELPWERVTLTLADERWVPPGHEDSNERLVREHLLRESAAAATFVPLYTGDAEPTGGLTECTRRLDGLPRPFDVVVLGMGTDGHFASLFPDTPELDEAIAAGPDTPCLAVPPPAKGHARMSLTPGTLLDARRVVLHVTGTAKREVLERAREAGPERELPVRLLLHQDRVPLEVFWSP